MCGVLVVRYLHNVHGSRQCGLAVCFCPLSCGAHETILDSHDVAFDHERPISTCPGHVVCLLGLLCCSVLLLTVKLCCGTALTAPQTVYQYAELSWQPHECSITGDYCMVLTV